VNNENKKFPFIKSSDNEKWEELYNVIEEFEYLNLNKTGKYILNNTKVKNKKNLFTILCAIYLECKPFNWRNVKKRIYELEKIPHIRKKNKDHVIIDKEKVVKLYINIGRDKKIFSKDLVHFIRQSMKIRSDQIQNIVIFENYSFFSIPDELVDKALILLSLKKFKGKSIIVNKAKKKEY